jgi:hypothetical protein
MENAIIGSLFSIIGIIIGWLLSTFTQNWILNRNNFYSAAKIFRESFAEEYSFLIKPVDDNFLGSTQNHIYRFVDNWLKKHEIAIINFWFYVPKNKKEEYKKAYQEYCYPNGYFPDNPRLDYHSEIGEKGIVENEKRCRKLLLERMEKLIEFAKN